MSKVIEHFKKHKAAYISSGICLGVGLGAGVIISNRDQVSNIIKNYNILSWKPSNVNVVQTSLERRGHPGNIIKCLNTGEVFASQKRASIANLIDPADMSRHLAGHLDSVKGLKFEKLGEALA